MIAVIFKQIPNQPRRGDIILDMVVAVIMDIVFDKHFQPPRGDIILDMVVAVMIAVIFKQIPKPTP